MLGSDLGPDALGLVFIIFKVLIYLDDVDPPGTILRDIKSFPGGSPRY